MASNTEMSTDLWSAVDDYISRVLIKPDKALENALKESVAKGLPEISVTPNQGKLLELFSRLCGARKILEIGTLGGYSTIWLARAVPSDGCVVSLEVDPHHAEVARSNIDRAGLSRLVEIRVGAALDTLPSLATERKGPFDLIFIDADKPNIPEYFAWAKKLSRKGSVIIVDNVIREGAIIDDASDDPSVRGVRRLNEMLAGDSDITATTIQTVGSKGYDGFTIALVQQRG
jgi:predicted O-methyltransferase YrrM